MSLQFSTSYRNQLLDLLETVAGTSPKLVFLTGSAPANCAAAETGTRVAVATLPADWMNDAASGQKTLKGTWEDADADATGTAGYFRLYDSAGTTCHVQGTVTLTGSGGDITLDNTNIQIHQDVKENSFTLTAPGA